MENVEKNKVDLKDLKILGGVGLLLLATDSILPFLSSIGFILEAIAIYRYSKILKNSKIWTTYLLYLITLILGVLIIFGVGGIFDGLAKISAKLAFGLIALIVMIAMFFYRKVYKEHRKVYKELGLSIKHDYFVKASDFILIITGLAIVSIFINFDNYRLVVMEVDLGQIAVFTMLAIGYFTSPKEIYLEEVKDKADKQNTN
jgi:hypothetical protein